MALKQKSVDDYFIALIKNLYHTITTHIDLKNEQSDPIRIHTGVKQGDTCPEFYSICYCSAVQAGGGGQWAPALDEKDNKFSLSR